MSRDGYRGPKLPQSLLEQVQNDQSHKGRGRNVSRKERRKTEREDKKSQRAKPRPALRNVPNTQRRRVSAVTGSDDEDEEEEEKSRPITAPSPTQIRPDAKPLRSILKKAKPAPPSDFEDSESEDVAEPAGLTISRGVNKKKLADDEAEINALEKKLGIKGKKSKALEIDGLDWLVDGSDGDSQDGLNISQKRKRPDDERWLRDKRLKATGREGGEDDVGVTPGSTSDSSLEGDDDPGMEDEVDFDEEDDAGSADFDFDAEDSEEETERDNDDEPPPAARRRENPYVPPVSNNTTKYVPPSLRKAATSDEESLRQLRRQLQGQLNRLSEANMLSILKSIDELYSKNARQHVTSTLVELLLGLISDPSTLNDTFLILHAGFTAALYKQVGTDFGAYVLENIVQSFDHHRNRGTEGKQTLNLLAFLSNLYTFQLVGAGLLFDYIRLLLEELSETNTELLLRIIRTSGPQLRHDDPSSLKDIVLLLQKSVATVGEANLSVRTKFMIETINDLKNNRVKTGVATSTMLAEHTTRMKKMLSSLNSSPRMLKATEPLRISLSDIRDSEKKGKWWLVGASYMDPNKPQSRSDATNARTAAADDAGYESETPGSVNLHKLARAQGMNTDVRRSIFVTLLSSADYREAHLRLLKLHLRSKQQLEIPRVLVHCVGAERAYNPFYELVARQFRGEHRMRKAAEFVLWDAFREMDDEAEEEEDQGDVMGMGIGKVVNLAKFYGTLAAHRAVDVRVLKKLDFTALSARQGAFVEMFLTTLLLQTSKVVAQEVEGSGGLDVALRDVFMRAAGVEGLARGLMVIIDRVVVKAEMVSRKRDKRIVKDGCEVAEQILEEAARRPTMVEDDEDGGSD